jgi:D-alanine transfer protein
MAQSAAPVFFKNAPTGFQVCPVGQAGTTPLIILQKLAALGPALAHRKIVVSLSPSWFLRNELNPRYYLGNFAAPVAMQAMLNPELSFGLKSEVAQRMLQFPDTVEKAPVLTRLLDCYASGRTIDRCLLVCLWPMAELEHVVFDLQEHLAALIYIRHHFRGALQISRLTRSKAGPSARTESIRTHQHRRQPSPAVGSIFHSDAEFLTHLQKAGQWDDLELLLRVIDAVGADALVLSMPLDGQYLDQQGVSRSARQAYYDKVRRFAIRYHCSVDTFEDHDADSGFLIAHRDHPTALGWMSFDRAIDQFFHNPAPARPPSTP